MTDEAGQSVLTLKEIATRILEICGPCRITINADGAFSVESLRSANLAHEDGGVPYWLNVTLPDFVPEGWNAHPTSAGWYYKGNEVLSEADLRALVEAEGGFAAMAHDPKA